VTQLEAVAFCL